VSIGVLLAAILAIGPPWLLALACLATALALVGVLAVRDGLFEPYISRRIDDDWF
jgi:hypothetical protein